jgi:hypothetical protein
MAFTRQAQKRRALEELEEAGEDERARLKMVTPTVRFCAIRILCPSTDECKLNLTAGGWALVESDPLAGSPFVLFAHGVLAPPSALADPPPSSPARHLPAACDLGGQEVRAREGHGGGLSGMG